MCIFSLISLMFYSCAKSISIKKTDTSHWEICPFYYPGMPCHNTFLSNFCHMICQVVAYRRLKTKENFKLLALDHGRLREVVTYKRFQIQWFEWETFDVMENWLLRRGGRLWEVVATSKIKKEIQKKFSKDLFSIF